MWHCTFLEGEVSVQRFENGWIFGPLRHEQPCWEGQPCRDAGFIAVIIDNDQSHWYQEEHKGPAPAGSGLDITTKSAK